MIFEMKAGIEKQPLFFSSYEQILSELINVPPKNYKIQFFVTSIYLSLQEKQKTDTKVSYLQNIFQICLE